MSILEKTCDELIGKLNVMEENDICQLIMQEAEQRGIKPEEIIEIFVMDRGELYEVIADYFRPDLKDKLVA